jgi:tetratricopeptide (TPR) repeat protein
VLFDLRSRGRRRTVQVVYIALAVLIGAGLILFGVGTGSGGGGLFGAFTGSGASGGSNGQLVKAVNQDVAKTKAQPSNAAAWAKLVQDRYSLANNSGFNETTRTYSAKAKVQLGYLTQAYEQYTKLVKNPSLNTALYAATAYGALQQFSDAAAAYQAVYAASPSDRNALECIAVTSYAAGNTRVGGLAETKFLSKVPKAQRKTIKSEITEAKKSKTIAAELC